MSWNHRVVKIKRECSIGYNDPYYYGIVEAYYNEDNDIWGHTDPKIISESVEDLLWTLEKMKKAVEESPVIDLENFEVAKCPFDDLTDEDLEELENNDE